MEFKLFLETEEEKNVKRTISKLPRSHQNLLKGYKVRFTPGNTLKGDDQHVGYIHKDKIVVAAGYHYGREWIFLHEVAHLVWEYKMTTKLKKEWKELFERTKKDMPKSSALNQNAEEIFCMVYANFYSKHKNVTYSHPKWQKFITKVPH